MITRFGSFSHPKTTFKCRILSPVTHAYTHTSRGDTNTGFCSRQSVCKHDGPDKDVIHEDCLQMSRAATCECWEVTRQIVRGRQCPGGAAGQQNLFAILPPLPCQLHSLLCRSWLLPHWWQEWQEPGLELLRSSASMSTASCHTADCCGGEAWCSELIVGQWGSSRWWYIYPRPQPVSCAAVGCLVQANTCKVCNVSRVYRDTVLAGGDSQWRCISLHLYRLRRKTFVTLRQWSPTK